MECLQVLNGARTAEIEGVLANADVARVVALTLRNMGELVFDRRALSQCFAPSRCVDLFAEPLLELLGMSLRLLKFGGGSSDDYAICRSSSAAPSPS